MDLKQIKYFVAVAEELHFGRAAQRMYISQPPLSMSIRKLEAELGFTLFVRTKRSVSLTDAGRVFYREALQLLRQAEEMRQVGARVAKGAAGSLKVGFMSSMLPRGLDKMVHAYASESPGVAVSLVEMNSSEQVDALRREQIDIGFVHNHPTADGISSRLFLSEHLVCCLPRGHALAGSRVVRIRDLSADAFLMFPRNLSPYYYDRIIAVCVNAGFSPVIVHEVRSWITIVEMVSRALGVALVPQSMAKRNDRNTVYLPIDNQEISSDTYCVWRSQDQSTLVKGFLSSVFGVGASRGPHAKPQSLVGVQGQGGAGNREGRDALGGAG